MFYYGNYAALALSIQRSVFYFCADRIRGPVELGVTSCRCDRKYGVRDVGFDSVVNGRAVEISKDYRI